MVLLDFVYEPRQSYLPPTRDHSFVLFAKVCRHTAFEQPFSPAGLIVPVNPRYHGGMLRIGFFLMNCRMFAWGRALNDALQDVAAQQPTANL